jgi:hypothetical protein
MQGCRPRLAPFRPKSARLPLLSVRRCGTRARRTGVLRLIDAGLHVNITEPGRIDLVLENGIAYDPKRPPDSVRGKIGRQAMGGMTGR